jgi:kynureninase
MFEMRLTYEPAATAGAFQIGTVPILSAAPLDGALDVLDDAGGVAVAREKSLALTDYLIDLVDERLPECEVGTPRAREERGGHVAVEHPEAARISEVLRERGVVVDYRPPNVVRVCPAPLYTRFEDVWHVVDRLRDIIDERAYERVGDQRGGVT